MSHDLYFCARGDEQPSRHDLLAWGGRQPHVSVDKTSETDFQFLYEHPDTGVYFSIDYDGSPAEDVEEMIGEGARYTGLSFHLNFVRPSFFALEAMPIVKAFADELGLLVCDPQASAEGPPAPPDVDALTESWMEGNRFAIGLLKDEERTDDLTRPPYLPPERSMDWWRYMHRRAALQDELGDKVYVPGIFLLCVGDETEVVTASTWAQGIPTVFPQTDFVILHRTKKKLLGLRKIDELGYVSHDALMGELGPLLDDVDEVVPLRMLTPEASKGRAAEVFRTIVIDTDMSRFQRIPSGGFLDVKP